MAVIRVAYEQAFGRAGNWGEEKEKRYKIQKKIDSGLEKNTFFC